MTAGTSASASLVVVLALAWTTTANAGNQRRDYFLDPPPPGVWAHADAFTLGAQATVESRTPIEDNTFGALSIRGSGLASIGYSEAAAHLDVRYLLLTFGATMGYRNVWRTYEDPSGGELSRDTRIATDSAQSFAVRAWGYGEARGRLVVPLDTFWFVTNHVVRWEDSPKNAYDWFHTNVHDGGFLYRGDAVLFARSATLGAIGPYVRLMDLPRNDDRRFELAAGLIYGIRPGLKSKDDLVSVFVLTRPADDEFGFHVLRLPLWTMVVYRASFRLFE
jgi:hypothetical protein